MAARPFSKPTAVDGSQGLISLDRGFAIEEVETWIQPKIPVLRVVDELKSAPEI
jgi:hypothetical protein